MDCLCTISVPNHGLFMYECPIFYCCYMGFGCIHKPIISNSGIMTNDGHCS